MAKRIILGAHLSNRGTEASAFQGVISQYGCNIKTRIGLHGVSEGACSNAGLILLEMYGEEAVIGLLEQKLRGLDGIQVQKMVFEE